MKNKLLRFISGAILAFGLVSAVPVQAQVDTSFVLVLDIQSEVGTATDTFEIEAVVPSDQLGLFTPLGIQVGMGIIDGSGRLYTVTSVIAASFGDCELEVACAETGCIGPADVGAVYRTRPDSRIPVPADGSEGVSEVLQTRIHLHNILQAYGASGAVDSIVVFQDSIIVGYSGAIETTRDTVHIVGSGGGTMSSFTVAGSTGTPQAITDGNTVTIAAGIGITTTAGATDQVTVEVDTAQIATQYDLSVVADSAAVKPSGTGTNLRIPVWTGINSLGSSTLLQSATGQTLDANLAFRITGGTTASRPTGAEGMQYWNTSNGWLDIHNGTNWFNPLRSATATGLGTSTQVGYFNSSGLLTSDANFVRTANSLSFTGVGGIVATTTTASGDALTVTGSSAYMNFNGGRLRYVSNNWQIQDNAYSTKVNLNVAASGTNFFVNSVNIGSSGAAARTLQVTGEARITDLTTDPPTQLVGADADGDLGAVTLGAGLSFSSGTLNGAFLPLTLTGTTEVNTAGQILRIRDAGGYPDVYMNSNYWLAASDVNTFVDVGSTSGQFQINAATRIFSASAGTHEIQAASEMRIDADSLVLDGVYPVGTASDSVLVRDGTTGRVNLRAQTSVGTWLKPELEASDVEIELGANGARRLRFSSVLEDTDTYTEFYSDLIYMKATNTGATDELQFGANAINYSSSSTGQLNITADNSLNITSDTVKTSALLKIGETNNGDGTYISAITSTGIITRATVAGNLEFTDGALTTGNNLYEVADTITRTLGTGQQVYSNGYAAYSGSNMTYASGRVTNASGSERKYKIRYYFTALTASGPDPVTVKVQIWDGATYTEHRAGRMVMTLPASVTTSGSKETIITLPDGDGVNISFDSTNGLDVSNFGYVIEQI